MYLVCSGKAEQLATETLASPEVLSLRWSLDSPHPRSTTSIWSHIPYFPKRDWNETGLTPISTALLMHAHPNKNALPSKSMFSQCSSPSRNLFPLMPIHFHTCPQFTYIRIFLPTPIFHI